MKYLIAQNNKQKSHAVKVAHSSDGLSTYSIPEFYTLCGTLWMVDNWRTVKTYSAAGSAKKATTCSRCLRALSPPKKKRVVKPKVTKTPKPKTHCRKGHPYAMRRFRINLHGHKVCKVCQRIRRLRFNALKERKNP